MNNMALDLLLFIEKESKETKRRENCNASFTNLGWNMLVHP